jgi:CBS domain containing-hemolysin-like protein
MIGFDVLLLLLLGAASILLASVEAAFYLMKGRRLHGSDPRVALVNQYLEDPPTLLMPVHMGAFTAHAGMTVVITALFLDHLSAWAMLVAFLAMVVYLVVFRLTLPYAIVRADPEASLLLLMPLFHVYAQALSPLVGALRRRAEVEPEPGAQVQEPEVPPPPVHDEDQDRLVDAVARFAETQVRQVMTPRPDVVAIPAASPVGEALRVVRESRYSRIPVFGENLDDIVGFVTVRDLLEYDGAPEDPLRPLAHPALLVPETKKIAELLKEMQIQHMSLAVAIDEYGGTAGVVSVEDIVEELVGEIKDEYDVETEPIAVAPDGSFLVAGRAAIDRLEQVLELSPSHAEGVGTAGGLVSMLFGRIPRVGEKIDYQGYTIEVLEAERKRVQRVRFRKKAE